MPGRNPISQKENRFEPDARGQAVLSAIIDEHLVTGEPIGSRVISDRFAHRAGWSSATIRNVMGELEESGFVEQPHTSAGRTPTDKGYRYYVDDLMQVESLGPEEQRSIQAEIEEAQDEQELMAHTASILGRLTRQLGVAVSPSV